MPHHRYVGTWQNCREVWTLFELITICILKSNSIGSFQQFRCFHFAFEQIITNRAISFTASDYFETFYYFFFILFCLFLPFFFFATLRGNKYWTNKRCSFARQTIKIALFTFDLPPHFHDNCIDLRDWNACLSDVQYLLFRSFIYLKKIGLIWFAFFFVYR